jgi:mannose-1-phosphate guanylyltransferase/phosphomannomutase
MKAIIMAGGEGSRLRPLTCARPKPMVPIVNRPCMEHIVSLLRSQEIREIGVTLQYLPEEIRNYFGDGKDFGVNLHYYIEDVPLGTAGSVENAASFLDETFIVISGDAVTDCSLQEAVAFHKERGALVTIVLTEVTCPLEYGVVITTKEGRITRFLEKSGWEEVFSDQVNTGIYILEPEVLDYIEANQQVDFSKDVFPKLLAMGKDMYAIVIKGKYWCDIGMTHTKVIQGIHMVQRSRRAVCPIPRRTRTIDSVSTLWHS